MLHARTGTLQVMYVKSIIMHLRSLQEKMCEKTNKLCSEITTKCNVKRIFVRSKLKLHFLGCFRFSAGFGHSPKYYLPIIALSHFAKVFSLQNFVLYGIMEYVDKQVDLCSPGALRAVWSRQPKSILKSSTEQVAYSTYSITIRRNYVIIIFSLISEQLGQKQTFIKTSTAVDIPSKVINWQSLMHDYTVLHWKLMELSNRTHTCKPSYIWAPDNVHVKGELKLKGQNFNYVNTNWNTHNT